MGAYRNKCMERKNVLEEFSQFKIPTYDEWREATEKSLKGASFEKKLLTHTYEGITLQPMYQKKDVEDLQYINSLPGEAPFLRGTKRIHTSRPWEISQELDISTPKAFNEVALHDLSRGQTTLNIVVDSATKEGKNANEAEQTAGRDGLSISALKDIETALKQINLEETPIHVHAGANSLPLFAQIIAYAQRNNTTVSGCIGMDPIGVLVAKGSLPYSLTSCYEAMANITFWANENMPKLQTVIVDGNPYHNGGSNAIQELAFALATGVEYLHQLIDHGISIDKAAQSIRFIFAIGSDYFTEIAKLRAARILWAKIVAAFGGKEEGQKMFIHARTSAWTKTKYDPYVNMLRDTSEAFAAAVGGADSIHVSPFDEPIQKSTAFSRRIARNASIILQEEAQIGKTMDPAGGSWYVEYLTDEIAKKTWALFQEVEEQGGIVECLKQGFPQKLVAEIREKRLHNLDVRKDVFVGTNMYANISEKPIEIKPEDDSELIQKHVDAVAQYPRKAVELTNDSLVKQAVAAASNGATIADLAEALGRGSGDITVEPIVATRATVKFEQLREATEKYIKKTGNAPKVFLANLGPIPSHKARSDFAAGFLEVARFEVIHNNGFTSAEDAVQAAIESKAEITVICGKDESYAEFAATIATKLKEQNKNMTVLLAGKPSEADEQVFKAAGIDDFIYIGANCYEILRKLQIEKGVASL